MLRGKPAFLTLFLGIFLSLISSANARDVVRYNAAGECIQGCAPTEEKAVVDNFEDGEIQKNSLSGAAGDWNIDPYDDNTHCQLEVVELKQGPDGKPSRALKVDYDVSSDTQDATIRGVKLGFWSRLQDLDASVYDHLEFDVKSDDEKGATTTFQVEIKRCKDENCVETLQGNYIVTGVSSQWQHVSIPLNVMNGILDWSKLREFVLVLQDRRVDKKEGVLYFDNIQFVKTGDPGPHVHDPVEIPGKANYPKLEAEEWARFLAKRLQGYPSKLLVKKEFPEEDRAFLKAIAKDTWKFFDNFVDKEHHLPLDTIQFSAEKKAVFGSDGYVGDYTNVTNIGLYLMCLVSAYDFQFLSKEEAVKRLKQTITQVEKLDHYNGLLYNYYDTSTGERSSNFISFVDMGWMAAGLYVAKNAFPEELGELCTKVLDSYDFSFFYDDVSQQMVHGYYTNIQAVANYHYGAFYTEPRAGSYIAIGRGETPVEHWFRLDRTLPDNYSWQTQEPRNRKLKTVLGISYYGGYYEYKERKHVPSWGGSMFEALMPTMILDEIKLSADSLGLNNKHHVLGQIEYTLEELEYPVWGMSPSSVPEGGYSEFGVKPLGLHGYKPGVVSPHATFLALEYAPEKAVANLRKMIELYDIYGEYGFYDAVTVETGLVAYKYLCLDQAMSFIALNNYLNDGAIRKRFHQDPINEKARPLLTSENLFEP